MKKAYYYLFLLVLLPFCLGNLSRGGWGNRYFKYNGKFTYFVGMDLQQLVSDSAIDYKRILDILYKHDINNIRIWLIANFLSDWPPNLYPYRRSNGLFDLYQWDDAYWSRLNAVLKYAEAMNIIVEISIFEISGPMSYFGQRADQPYPFHKKFNVQNFGTPNANGTFVPEFFELNYQENGIRLQDIQKTLIDKVLKETADIPNVYYELMNEFPGTEDMVENPAVQQWANEMARYLDSKTDKLITIHGHGYGYKRTPAELEASSSNYWDRDYVDGLNFHLSIFDPNKISQMLHGHQQKRKMLICNEGEAYYDIDRSKGYPKFKMFGNKTKLYKEIRAMWGYITAGGYYSFYTGPVPLVEDPVALEAANAGQAARHIVETLPFWQMQPVRADGTEYDDIVLQGPTTGWQVTALENRAYLIYFWGKKASSDHHRSVNIILTPARYEYKWYDARKWGAPLKSGIAMDDIPSPLRGWDPGAGVILTLIEIP